MSKQASFIFCLWRKKYHIFHKALRLHDNTNFLSADWAENSNYEHSYTFSDKTTNNFKETAKKTPFTLKSNIFKMLQWMAWNLPALSLCDKADTKAESEIRLLKYKFTLK